MRELRNINSDLKLLQNFCHNDAYIGPLMANTDKSLHPFLKYKTKAWSKPGYINQSNAIYRAKVNLPVIKNVTEVFSSTISFGGKILFVCPITTFLESSTWDSLEELVENKTSSSKILKNFLTNFSPEQKEPDYIFTEEILEFLPVIDRYSWICPLGHASLTKDLLIVDDEENSSQKIKEGSNLLLPFIPLGSPDIKNVSYPLNINTKNLTMHSWYFFILNESLHRGLRNRSLPKKSRRINDWISNKIVKKIPIHKSKKKRYI